MRAALAVMFAAVATLVGPAGPADAHYPPRTAARGADALERRHHRLHELNGHAVAVVKHTRSYRELVWHRRALNRPRTGIRAQLRAVHAELRFRHELRGTGWSAAVQAAAWAWYRTPACQCVVNHEGGWDSFNAGGCTGAEPDGCAGRFQMDYSFERETRFGAWAQRRWGRAYNWPDWAQVFHAYEVWSYAGWSRWPTFAAYCS